MIANKELIIESGFELIAAKQLRLLMDADIFNHKKSD